MVQGKVCQPVRRDVFNEGDPKMFPVITEFGNGSLLDFCSIKSLNLKE